MQTKSFEQFGGIMAILTGIAGFFYAVSFIVLQNVLLSAIFLTLLGLLASPALVALYYRVRNSEPAFALWALLLGLAGAMGAGIHGGYDLANAMNPPQDVPTSITALPSPIDPRGLLAFGVAGVALLFFSWLIGRSVTMPHELGYLGFISGILLVVLYLGRLVVLNPSNPVILIPALLNGFIVNPIFYIWLGIVLWQPVLVRTANYRGPERRTIERRQLQI